MISALLALLLAQDAGALINSMDDVKIREPKEKGHAAAVEGKVGKAVKFSFDDGCASQFCMTPIRGAADWDQAAGFSFWVKGDGSKRFGGIQLIWNEDYAVRYDYAFPIDGTDWKKITVAWRDLVPVLPNEASKPIDPKTGNAPSKFTALWFGKWYYWRDYAAHSYAIDEIRLEPKIAIDADLYVPSGAPLERTLAKLKAKKPITVVTMGDSLTDYNHWANKPVNWPGLFTKLAKEKHGVEVTLLNPAIGGTQLRQGLVTMPRWLAETPEPDLVTICYGYNDWDSGMRGALWRDSIRDAIDRVRRATKGKSDVLILTSAPAVERWTTMAELGDNARAAATERNAGIADVYKAFHDAEGGDKDHLYCRDKVHLGPAGHEVVARAVLNALDAAGRP